MLNFARHKKEECLIMKVDFAKAYDCISWEYLRNILGQMCFSIRWLLWMNGLIFNNTILILVNGSPTEDFVVRRGIRQGDLFSPFLFLIVDEWLAGLMRNAVNLRQFSGVKMGESVHL